MPVGAAEPALFPERGFVNLNNTDACSFQFQNLFPDCKADLYIISCVEISSLGNDQCKIVTGPVSIPFTSLSVRELA